MISCYRIISLLFGCLTLNWIQCSEVSVPKEDDKGVLSFMMKVSSSKILKYNFIVNYQKPSPVDDFNVKLQSEDLDFDQVSGSIHLRRDGYNYNLEFPNSDSCRIIKNLKDTDDEEIIDKSYLILDKYTNEELQDRKEHEIVDSITECRCRKHSDAKVCIDGSTLKVKAEAVGSDVQEYLSKCSHVSFHSLDLNRNPGALYSEVLSSLKITASDKPFSLRLGGGIIEESVMHDLFESKFKNVSQCEKLTIENCVIDKSAGGVLVGHLGSMVNLVNLSLADIPNAKEFIGMVIDNLPKLKSLRSLELIYLGLDEASLKPITKLSNVISVSLDGNTLTKTFFDQLPENFYFYEPDVLNGIGELVTLKVERSNYQIGKPKNRKDKQKHLLLYYSALSSEDQKTTFEVYSKSDMTIIRSFSVADSDSMVISFDISNHGEEFETKKIFVPKSRSFNADIKALVRSVKFSSAISNLDIKVYVESLNKD